MSNNTTNTVQQSDKHEKHQALMESHKQAKYQRKEDHNNPNRKKKVPPNSLK